MTAINRKLLRDLWHLRGQVVAIALVVACGVATVVTSRTAYESLTLSRADYYARYRFADVFAQLKRAPEAVAAKLAAIPGVAAIQTRVVFDVTLDVPGLAEPATGRLIAVPERGRPALNDLALRRGRYPASDRRDEVVVSEAFAEANRLAIGDPIGAILNGRWAGLRVVGVALSPEYIYEIRPGDLFPDSKRFGVLWMSRAAMGPAFDMDGAFNDVVLGLAAGASEPEVIASVDRVLEPYGGLGAYGREDHVSHRFISDEIRQNQVFGTVLPVIFLGVAAFLLNVVLSRLIATQRDQIGVLKAFGYGHRAVSGHYLQFALLAVAVGAVIGTSGGLWLGARINELYSKVYRFPLWRYDPSAAVVLLAIGASGLAALLGALGAVRRAWAVPAAEAMRPEPPATFRAGLLERLDARGRLAPSTRMIVRSLARRPLRAGLSVLGIALAVAILVLGRYFVDAIDHLALVQFRLVQREHANLVAHEQLPARARHALAHLPGVLRAEPFRVVPARLRAGHRTRRVLLMGLSSATGLRRLVGANLRAVALPPEGVVLTVKLAEVLGVAPGETVTVEVLEGSRPVRTATLSGVVDELIGLSAYMDLGALNCFMREGATVSGTFALVDPQRWAELHARVKGLPVIGGVVLREAMLEGFEKTLGESLGIFTLVLIGFASVIAVAVVYNATRIALSERGRELASLRVLGFTRREVTVMLLGEHAIVTVLAIPLGFALGYATCAAMAAAYQWELFRLPLVVTAHTWGFATAVIAGAALGSAWIVRRRLDRLDLVAVLKARE
jgi:putative ABC transport system permease protein